MLNLNPSQDSPSPKSPVSERKAAANRANAQRSTGPRTPQGKARSSLNALRHGILAKAAYNPTIEGKERRTEFEELVTGFAQEYQPRTATEHMMVQQLAGCYWKLAKVWEFEQEAAWRGWIAPGIPIEEYNQFHDKEDPEYPLPTIRDRLVEKAREFLPTAGLDRPTIPNGASARTVLRYQGAINSMLFRCLNFLERRRKERIESEEAFEELDYTNEPTAAAQSEAERPAPAEKHKRTQNDTVDAPVSSEPQQESAKGPAQTATPSTRNREETA